MAAPRVLSYNEKIMMQNLQRGTAAAKTTRRTPEFQIDRCRDFAVDMETPEESTERKQEAVEEAVEEVVEEDTISKKRDESEAYMKAEFRRMSEFLARGSEQQAPPPTITVVVPHREMENVWMSRREFEQRSRGDCFFGIDRVSADEAGERLQMSTAEAESTQREAAERLEEQRREWETRCDAMEQEAEEQSRAAEIAQRKAYLRHFAEGEDAVDSFDWSRSRNKPAASIARVEPTTTCPLVPSSPPSPPSSASSSCAPSFRSEKFSNDPFPSPPPSASSKDDGDEKEQPVVVIPVVVDEVRKEDSDHDLDSTTTSSKLGSVRRNSLLLKKTPYSHPMVINDYNAKKKKKKKKKPVRLAPLGHGLDQGSTLSALTLETTQSFFPLPPLPDVQQQHVVDDEGEYLLDAMVAAAGRRLDSEVSEVTEAEEADVTQPASSPFGAILCAQPAGPLDDDTTLARPQTPPPLPVTATPRKVIANPSAGQIFASLLPPNNVDAAQNVLLPKQRLIDLAITSSQFTILRAIAALEPVRGALVDYETTDTEGISKAEFEEFHDFVFEIIDTNEILV